jgi:hypothetical protein
MPGSAGADDPALEQARLAQLTPRAYADAWLCRYTAGTSARRPALPAQAADVQEGGGAEAGAVPTRAGASGATAPGGSVQTAEAKQAACPKPVPPTLAPGQRKAALSKARALNGERKEIRDQLHQGRLSLAQVLAQDREAARGMRVATVVRALPGIGAATAARLMAQAGIDGGRRVGGLTAGQRERLVAAVAVVGAELAASRDRRHHSGQ